MKIPLPTIDGTPACTTRFVIIAYTKAFESHYGIKPSVTTVDRCQASQLARKLGTERNASFYIQAYLELNDKWLDGQGKPLRLLSRSIQAINVSLAGPVRKRFNVDENATELVDSPANAAHNELLPNEPVKETRK